MKHFLPILYERIASGDLTVEKPLGITATIQESCHAKFLGDEFMDIPRKLLEKIGVRVVEMEKSRDRMLCCGIGGGFLPSVGVSSLRGPEIDHYRRDDRPPRRNRRGGHLLCRMHADLRHRAARLSAVFRRPRTTSWSWCRWPQAKTPLRRNKKRARTMFLGIMRNQMPMLLSRRRFRSDTIETSF